MLDVALVTPVVWSEVYRINVPLIDTQHQRLFQLIEELRLSFFMKKSEAFVEKTLKGLMSYCMEHFESEELLLQTVGYPTQDSHAQLHRMFEAQTRAWLSDYEKGGLDEENMIRTLVDWLVSHVMTSDVAYANFCHQKGFDMSEIRVVSDLADFMEREVQRSVNIRVEIMLTILLLPSLIFLCLFAFWNPDPIRIGLGVAAAVVEVLLGIVIILYVNLQIALRIRTMRAPYARRLAENLLAGEIASRISVLDLDNIEQLFQNVEGSLVQSMKEICDHVQMYLPYLPTTVLALIRTGEKEEEEAQSMVLASMGVTVVATGRKSARPMQTVRSSGMTTTTVTDLNSELGTNRSGGEDSVNQTARVVTGVPRSSSGGNAASSLLGAGGDASARSGGVGNSTQRKHLNTHMLSAGPQGTHRSTVSGDHTHRKKSFIKYSMDFGAPGTQRSIPKPSTLSSGTKDMLDRWLAKKAISVMVTEITGFEQSAISISSAELIDLHAKYVVLVQEISKATRGVFNSLVGDRVVVTWNAANNVGNHAEQACNAAVSMRDTLQKNKDFLGRKLHTAVASGLTYVGNMGSKTKLSFCVLGAVPALAEALCQLNLYLRTEILVSPQTWKDVSDMFLGKLITPIELLAPNKRSAGAGPMLSPKPSSQRQEQPQVLNGPGQKDDVGMGEMDTVEASDLIFGDVLPSPHTASSATTPSAPNGAPTGTGGAGGISSLVPGLSVTTSMPPATTNAAIATVAGSPPMIVVELKAPIASESDEWMYQLQDASNKDPFKQYNEAARNLMTGVKQDAALAQLKEYVDSHFDDIPAREFYKTCQLAVKRNQPIAALIWRHGWMAPIL